MNNNIDSIIEQYSNYVFKIINNVIDNSLPYEDKKEILSDTFYLFWKHQKEIKTSEKAYLAAIARNLSYQKLRDNNLNLEYDDNIITTYSNTYDNTYIEDILSVLNNEEKEIFRLYYVDGYKIKEIAQITNKSVSAIKMRMLRLKRKIRKEIKYE